VLVRLPDGRRRSIPRSITDLAKEPFQNRHDSIEESLRVSVRTLLPLARFLAARSSALEGNGDEYAVSAHADAADSCSAQAIDPGDANASALENALRERQDAACLDGRRDSQTQGVSVARGSE
jgi:hypothetical protein